MKKPSNLPDIQRTRSAYEWGHIVVRKVLEYLVVAIVVVAWLGIDEILGRG